MMLLMLARRVPEQLVTFAKRGLGEPLGMQLSGKTLGIIGMGAIGAAAPALPRPPRAPPASGAAQKRVGLRRQACGWRGPHRRWACTCAGTGLPARPPSSARCWPLQTRSAWCAPACPACVSPQAVEHCAGLADRLPPLVSSALRTRRGRDLVNVACNARLQGTACCPV